MVSISPDDEPTDMLPRRFFQRNGEIRLTIPLIQWITERYPNLPLNEVATKIVPHVVHAQHAGWLSDHWWGVVAETAPSGWMRGYRQGREGIMFVSLEEAVIFRLRYDGPMAPSPSPENKRWVATIRDSSESSS